MNGNEFTEEDLQLIVSSTRCEEFLNLTDINLKRQLLEELRQVEIETLTKLQNSQHGLRGGNPLFGESNVDIIDSSYLNSAINNDYFDPINVDEHIIDDKASKLIQKIVSAQTYVIYYLVSFMISSAYLELLGGTLRARTVYNLTGVVHHLGNSPNHGHYIADILNEKSWVRYDDTKVNKVLFYFVVCNITD